MRNDPFPCYREIKSASSALYFAEYFYDHARMNYSVNRKVSTKCFAEGEIYETRAYELALLERKVK